MELNEKLDKIIDLLVAQNNLLTSMMLSLRQSGPAQQLGASPFLEGANAQFGKTNNIKAEIERRIQDARMEAQAKISKIQATVPEFQDNLKG